MAFADPDGHPWEVAHNPRWTITDDGRTLLALGMSPGLRGASVARPGAGPARRPAASLRSALPLRFKGDEPQALALPWRVLRRADGLRGAGQGRTHHPDVLGGLGPARGPAAGAHRELLPGRPRSRSGREDGTGAADRRTRATAAPLVHIEARHPEAGRRSRLPAHRRRDVGRERLPERRGRLRLDPQARRCRSSSTFASADRIRSRSRRGASRTSRPATTRGTRSGAGPPASAP